MLYRLNWKMRASIALMATAIAGSAAAQASYPSKPIVFVVPLAAGGVHDRMMRALMGKLSKTLGQPVIIENKPGANGTIGANMVAKAPPDGYTVCVCHSSPVSLAKASMEKLPYDIDKAFVPVTRIYDMIPIITASANSPYASLPDMLKAAAAGRHLSYGHTGLGGALHLGFERLKQEAKVDITAVGYNGEAPLLPDLMAGRLDSAMVSPQTAKVQFAAGKLKILASMGSPSPLPNVPSLADMGFPGFHVASWLGFFLPAGTPGPVVRKLYDAIQVAVTEESFSELVRDAGLQPVVGQTPEQFQTFLNEEKKSWSEVTKAMGHVRK